MQRLITVAREARACTLCEAHLPLGPRPVFQVSREAPVLIAAQAPGLKVHESGVPFDDPSGDRLRDWLGIDRVTFYDVQRIALLPMGFCYPGRGKSGDLPPRPECARTWRERFMSCLDGVRMTLVIGQYAHRWHLRDATKSNLTETVRAWREFAPSIFPLPHPSPRNNIWLKKNPWFVSEVVPELRQSIKRVLE
ncbi:MAG: uracil-DNA glycosylase family protein [Chloroflexi bacterium]|nr:MAG: uracil-DNA glycosylase family protein [Chloroflexota bacterium]